MVERLQEDLVVLRDERELLKEEVQEARRKLSETIKSQRGE